MDYFIELYQGFSHKHMIDNLYKHLNYYLRTGKISPKLKEPKKYKFSTINEFKLFLVNMTNNLMNHIHYQKNNEIKYVYRGETRSKFDFKKGDVIIYPQFVSTSTKTGHAIGFSGLEVPKKVHLFYCIKLHEDTKILKMDKSFKFHMQYCGDFEMFEHEYVLPPLTHFRIISIKDIPEIKLKIINLEVIYQQFNLLKNFDDKFKSDYKITKHYKTYEYNNELKKFITKIFKCIQNNKKINIIPTTINDSTKNILNMSQPWGDCVTNIFDLDLKKILKTKKNDLSKLSKKYKTNIFGKNYKLFKERIKNVIKVKNIKTKDIGTIKAYSSNYYTPLKNNTSMICTFNYDTVLYQGVYNNFYPNKKHNNKLDYNKYIFKLTIISKNVNIVRPKNNDKLDSVFFIIPPYKYKINSHHKTKNKWGLPIYIYDITVY